MSKKVELNNVEASAAVADIGGSHLKLLSAVQHLQVALLLPFIIIAFFITAVDVQCESSQY